MDKQRLVSMFQGILTAGSGGKPPQDSTTMMLYILMFLFIGMAFYFIMIRPAKKEQSERTKTLASMKKGDKVVTIGGIHGTIAEMEEDNTVILEVAKNVRIKFLRSAISTVVTKSSDATEEKG